MVSPIAAMPLAAGSPTRAACGVRLSRGCCRHREHQARGEAAGADAFRRIDVPLAATHLAQGSGRLIRTRSDRGVVALMDPRLALRRDGYGRDLQQCLPPMAKTISLDDALVFLGTLAVDG